MCIIPVFIHITDMRTNIAIDDKLMDDALKVTGAATKKEVVELGFLVLRNRVIFRTTPICWLAIHSAHNGGKSSLSCNTRNSDFVNGP